MLKRFCQALLEAGGLIWLVRGLAVAAWVGGWMGGSGWLGWMARAGWLGCSLLGLALAWAWIGWGSELVSWVVG